MSLTVFVSAVSNEFARRNPRNPRDFESYREILKRSLRILVRDCRVIDQEELAQGPGDLLATLDAEVQRSDWVVHLVGDLAGVRPHPAELRELHERHPNWLLHKPELRALLSDESQITYTQWEIYFAYQHNRGRLVFRAHPESPRSPLFTEDPDQKRQQSEHFERLRAVGEHSEPLFHQSDLARKVVRSIERNGGTQREESTVRPEAVAAAREDVESLAAEVSAGLRSLAKQELSEWDPARIEVFLKSIDTAALQREIDRRTALQLLEEHQAEARQLAEEEPSPANLSSLAMAELAIGNWGEAVEAARQAAQEQVRAMLAEPEQQTAHREPALNAFLLWHEAARLHGQQQSATTALEQACSLIDRAVEPVFWAEMQQQLAEHLLNIGQFDRAEELIDEILDIREEQGEGDPALPECLLLWCRVLLERANYQGVIDVAARAERLFRAQSPPNLSEITRAFSSRATALHRLGRFAEAEPLLRQALAIAEQGLGPNHPNVAGLLDNLAILLQDTNRLHEAEPLTRRAMAIFEQSYGPHHPHVATNLNNLALLLKATNRRAEAEPLYRRALAIDEHSLGPDHPSVATVLGNLASLLQDTNRLAEAEPLMRRVLVILEQSYGPHHPHVATSLNNLASLLQDTNHLAEAEPLLRRALAIDEQSFGPDHPKVATDLNNLTQLLQATNRLAEAEPLLRRALAIDEQSYGPKHPHVATNLNNLASLLQATNRLAEAEPLLRRALAIDEQSLGLDHPDVASDLSKLASLLKATNRLNEAESLMRRALAIDEQSFGPHHPHVALNLNNLALLLQAINRLVEAELLLRRALAINEQSYGPHHPNVAANLNNLAQLLQATKRLAEAEPLLRRALAIYEQCYGPVHPNVALNLNNLALLLQATNRLVEAEPLIQQMLMILFRFTVATGHVHPNLDMLIHNFRGLSKEMGRTEEQIQSDLVAMSRVTQFPLEILQQLVSGVS
jgi:tetratricopeptide (TPR) repeat protein